jgi:hypothetical protein
LEDRTRFTHKNAAQVKASPASLVMACVNNLILAILAKQQRFRFVPSSARRFFEANPLEALALITRLSVKPCTANKGFNCFP